MALFKKLRDLDPLVHLSLFFCIVLLLSGFVFLYNKTSELSSQVEVAGENGDLVVTKDCDEECKGGLLSEVKKMISAAVATISAVPKTVATKVTTSQRVGSTVFIPLDGSTTTTSGDWMDIKNAEVTLDFEKDYGAGAKISWDAFLKVAHGNGKAFARLFDTTHGTAIDGSEISISTGSSTLVSSGEIRPWSGRNNYRVQLKSLNTFEVTYDSGRIKVSY